ncbi:acyltransferase, partial [Akkermansiaceae bacterium]|nr:acyltransferase [Akkermansiaceae bacterium]
MKSSKNITQVMTYRPDIDGLRAVSVLGVVLFHAGAPVTGGFAGVDVFFVISGYLITGILIREMGENRFSIVRFWERRIRRILPVLFCVTLVTLIAGALLMLPFGFQVVGQSSVAVFLMASNIQFYRTTGYFDPSAEENPLLHTWSLSVEEQFYLVLPLLLLLVFRLRMQRNLGPMIWLVIAGSLGISVFWLARDSAMSFYLLPSRAWELAVGSLLAARMPSEAGKGVKFWGGWAGLALIVATFFVYTPETPFPGFAAMVPVAGAALVIWAGVGSGHRHGVGRWLSCRPLVAVGLASYSFYLWHWPFFAFHRYITSNSPSAGV